MKRTGCSRRAKGGLGAIKVRGDGAHPRSDCRKAQARQQVAQGRRGDDRPLREHLPAPRGGDARVAFSSGRRDVGLVSTASRRASLQRSSAASCSGPQRSVSGTLARARLLLVGARFPAAASTSTRGCRISQPRHVAAQPADQPRNVESEPASCGTCKRREAGDVARVREELAVALHPSEPLELGVVQHAMGSAPLRCSGADRPWESGTAAARRGDRWTSSWGGMTSRPARPSKKS